MSFAGFRRAISHPASVGREFANKGVMDKQSGFAVAGERQDSDVMYVRGLGGLIKDKPAIWRPARGPPLRVRQQQLLAAGPVGIHLVNAQPCLVRSAAEQNAATIRRPGRKSVANP